MFVVTVVQHDWEEHVAHNVNFIYRKSDIFAQVKDNLQAEVMSLLIGVQVQVLKVLLNYEIVDCSVISDLNFSTQGDIDCCMKNGKEINFGAVVN